MVLVVAPSRGPNFLGTGLSSLTQQEQLTKVDRTDHNIMRCSQGHTTSFPHAVALTSLSHLAIIVASAARLAPMAPTCQLPPSSSWGKPCSLVVSLGPPHLGIRVVLTPARPCVAEQSSYFKGISSLYFK